MERLQRIDQTLAKDDIKEDNSGELTLLDNRTGKTVKLGVKESKDSFFIDAKGVGKLVDHNGEPLRVYDPGYMNTICNTSKICYIDGDKGVLEYRGIPIEQLAENSSFLEVAFLLIYG